MTLSYHPARSTTSVLVHVGDLRSNLVGNTYPSQYVDLQDVVPAGSVPSNALNSDPTPYVPPDAGVITAMGYDEIVVDVKPVVNADGSVGVIAPASQNAFRQISMTDRPYWIVVRTDGYGVVTTRSAALLTALRVMGWAYQHAQALLMSNRLRGFAFLAPDLNVQFPDLTVIDRLYQNQLIQQCWSLGCSCTFITSRPADATCAVGPLLKVNSDGTTNPNSGATLPYSILGTNPVQRDRLMVAYPYPQMTGQSIGVLMGMLAGLIGTRGRDPGFTLNMDVSLLTPVDETAYVSDAVIGTNDPVDWLQRVHAFAASFGVTTLAVGGTQYVLPSERYLPPDAGVNVSGAVRASSTDGVTTVRYANSDGTTNVRAFDRDFTEITSQLGTGVKTG